MTPLIRITASRAPYRRAGFAFTEAPGGKTVAVVEARFEGIEPGSLPVLLADPHLDVMVGDHTVGFLPVATEEEAAAAAARCLAPPPAGADAVTAQAGDAVTRALRDAIAEGATGGFSVAIGKLGASEDEARIALERGRADDEDTREAVEASAPPANAAQKESARTTPAAAPGAAGSSDPGPTALTPAQNTQGPRTEEPTGDAGSQAGCGSVAAPPTPAKPRAPRKGKSA